MLLHEKTRDVYFTLSELKREYNQYKAESEPNTEKTFSRYLLSCFIATIRKENDVDIIGITRDELNRIIEKLMK